MLAFLCLCVPRAGAAAREIRLPFEKAEAAPLTPLDSVVDAALRKRGIEGANPCADEVFVRRVYLDLIGTLPEPREIYPFLQDTNPDKRMALVEALMARDEFADYWAMKWCDVLRVKAEFPINLWPNAVQAYHRWIRDAMRDNMPYDRFARELLGSSGSNFRAPPVNFYRAVQGREPSALAGAVALTFMGSRFEKWPEPRRKGMEAFFSRVAYKPTAEWKEEIVCLNPEATTRLTAVFPDGDKVVVEAGQDPRKVFAEWLVRRNNQWFARAMVNRAWAWFFGRGIVHEPDDIRDDNPPSNPALLAHLEKEFLASNYDLRQLFRTIIRSRTYQQSSIPRSEDPAAAALFAYYPVRRLEAEVLIDALCSVTGTRESYSSIIPEPFTWIPETQRAVELADGSITSQFLEMFGRPPRDTGAFAERASAPSDAQRLHLLNSTHVQGKLQRGGRLNNLISRNSGNPREMIRTIYYAVLSRGPTEDEYAAAEEYVRANKSGGTQGAQDLAWALINSKEFLYRH